MASTYSLSPAACLFHADARDALKALPADSLDSCVTDPPYALVSIVKRFGGANAAPAKGNEAYMRASQGFMGKQWDVGDVAFDPEFWREVYRVLKPGAHLVAMGGTRTQHRLVCAIEDAGFEIRDQIYWHYATGFPKSHDVSKGIDKAAGVVCEKGPIDPSRAGRLVNQRGDYETDAGWSAGNRSITIDPPATPEALEWQGWGTALKPATEPIVLARKPLSEGTVAANVLKWRTGAINVDGCRVATEAGDYASGGKNNLEGTGWGHKDNARTEQHAAGRWPANVVTDGSDEVVGCFPNTGGGGTPREKSPNKGSAWAIGAERSNIPGGATYCDQGSASRFFKACPPDAAESRFHYSAKASKADRNGSKHPTVKPIALMQWLARLITPPGGTVLDPFAGSGTTGAACVREGFNCVLVEREAEYVRDIVARFASPPLVPDLAK